MITNGEHNNTNSFLISGAFISLFFGLIGYFIMFIFHLFTARIFGPEKLGFFEMSYTILNIAAIISVIGISGSIGRYLSFYEVQKDHEKLNGYLNFTFIIPIIVSLIVSFLLFNSADKITYFFKFNDVFVDIIKIIALAVPFKAINDIIYKILLVKRLVVYQNIAYNVIEKIVLIAGLLAAVYLNYGFISIILFLLFANVLAFMFSAVVYKAKVKFEKTSNSVYLYKEWFMFSAPLLISNMFAFIINWTDNIVIGKIMTSTDVGIYSTAFALASFLIFFQTAFFSIFYPEVAKLYAKGDLDGLRMNYSKAQKMVFALALPFALLFVFLPKEILLNLYGKNFIGSTLPLVILTVGMTINIFTGLNPAILRIMKKTALLFRVKMIAALANVVLAILLVKQFGIIGAAISVTSIITLEQLFYMYKAKKLIGTSHDVISNLKIFLVGIILIAGIKTALHQANMSIDINLLFLTCVIYLMLYCIALFKLKILNVRDLQLLKR